MPDKSATQCFSIPRTGWGSRYNFRVVSSRRAHTATIQTLTFGPSAHKTILPMRNAITTDDTVATIPGTIKLWFKTYLPIRVVPVWSKDMAARSVG